MLKDDQVSVVSNLKKDIMLSSGYDIVCEEEDQEDIKRDVEIALSEDPDWPIEDMFEEMLTHLDFGFSISEKVFKKRDDGSIGLKWIKTRHPGPWLFHQDDAGNIIRYEQQGTTTSVNVPPNVLIHMINRRRFQNPYGTPELRAAYQAWFAKKHVTRWYAIFIEKSASPIPHGKYGKEATPKAKEELYNSLKKFQTKSTIVTPDYMEVEFLESKTNGEAFIKGINLFNLFIARAMLLPDLLGFGGSETIGGSFSLGANQMEVFFKHLAGVRHTLEKTINNHIIWPIVVHNHGFMENYPKLKFRPISKAAMLEYVKVWLDAVKSRAWKPSAQEIEHFRDLVNFPNNGEETEINPLPKDDNPMGESIDDNADSTDLDVDISDSSDTDDMGNNKDEFKKFAPTPGPYSKKTDFKVIEQQLNEANKSFESITKPLVNEIINGYIDQIDKKNVLQDINKINDISLKKTKTLNAKINKAFKDLYKKSKEIAQSEVIKNADSFAKPIVDQSFIKILEQENFDFIGDWEYKVTQGARLAIIQAIKDGESIARVTKIINDDVKRAAEISLERYARTKFTEVMNKGRVAYFEQSKVVQGYQYSAILDDRTTPICQGLHGKRFKKGDQPIPPMHFNALLEGTLIETRQGKLPIENVTIGDIVLTHKGNWCEVYDTMNKFEDKEYFCIELENGKEINITGEHPVFTDEGWIRADELLFTDNIICLENVMSKIARITRKKIASEKLYNLAVKQDESYIANEIVVHNCRSVLIPITIFEEFKPTDKIGQRSVDQFIDDEKGKGFPKQ
jgi:SPP1 gp7 family putative phage head morphogenesis protein